MKIGLYAPTYPGVHGEGGIGTYTSHLARGLAARGHRVVVVVPGEGPPVDDAGVAVERVRIDHIRGLDRLVPGAGMVWKAARAMRRVVLREGLDLVEFPNWEGVGLAFTSLRPCPTVVRLYTSMAETQVIDGLDPSRRLRWDARRERWSARRADQLVTHSRAHRRTMCDELGIPEDRIEIVPLGVSADPCYTRPPRPPGPPRVVFLGRMEKRKGSYELLEAARSILGLRPDVRFDLIGADRAHCPGRRSHADYLRDEFPPAMQAQIRMLGRLPDEEVNRHLQAADLFVAPSLYESFGLVFLEAMRWATPVVGTTAGGIPEVVEHGESGWLVPPGDADALARSILALLDDEALRRRLGEAGRRRVLERFSVDCMAENVEALYERTIARRPSGTARRAPTSLAGVSTTTTPA